MKTVIRVIIFLAVFFGASAPSGMPLSVLAIVILFSAWAIMDRLDEINERLAAAHTLAQLVAKHEAGIDTDSE